MGGSSNREVVIIRSANGSEEVFVGEAYKDLPEIVRKIAKMLADRFVQ